MDNVTRILLERNRNKRSVNTSSGVHVGFTGSRRMLPTTEFIADISDFEQYRKERAESTKFRLTFQVNTVCSNILHNKITEIVKKEGSDDVSVLNYGVNVGDIGNKFMGGRLTYVQNIKRETASIGSNDADPIRITNAIRDTSISSDGYVYHCGSDIFNNHLLRSKTFKCVCMDGQSNDSSWFNTIGDLMRDANGGDVVEKIVFPTSANVPKNSKDVLLHLYEYDDVLTYKDCLDTRLIRDYDGWVGFYNTSKIKSFGKEDSDTGHQKDLMIERPIMYKNGGDFVDMYPTRDLFSFIPKYNKYRHRLEKNWNYCLTYPSSSTTAGFDDIIYRNLDSMRTYMFDENNYADNGTKQLVMYSVAKHGLKTGDKVNVYKSDTLVIREGSVTNVADDFIFTMFNQGVAISTMWVDLEDEDTDMESSGYTMSSDGTYFYDEDGNKYPIVNGRYVNLDLDATNVTYKKVVGGVECEYYVRIFSRIPNFEHASGATSSEYDLYRDDSRMIKEYQKPEYDFSSEVSRLAFAQNIYSDEIGQIVYTGDIDIANLKDNLGRPLTSIFLTIVKNNRGYKQWYGFSGNRVDVSSDEVEYSHCFGKVTCGMETADYTTSDVMVNNIHAINNANIPYGYDVSIINVRGEDIDSNEVWYYDDVNYYGDLVCHDFYNALEEVIEPVMHRFNTAQRESAQSESRNNFASYFYDEIDSDDYDKNDKFVLSEHSSSEFMDRKCNNLREGYYYKPHYEIKVRGIGERNTMMPDFLPIKTMISDATGTKFNVTKYHYLSCGDKCMLYDKLYNKVYYCTVIEDGAKSPKAFTCKVTKEDGTDADDIQDILQSTSDETRLRYKLFKIDNLDMESYAYPLKDGTCRMIWRDIYNNGCGNFVDNEEYPFTNGAFYINVGLNLYVRRQDPNNWYGLYSMDDEIGVVTDFNEEDTYVKEEDTTC